MNFQDFHNFLKPIKKSIRLHKHFCKSTFRVKFKNAHERF